MGEVFTAYTRERQRRGLIGRYRTISTDTEEEPEPEAEVTGVFFFVFTKKNQEKKVTQA